MTMRPMYFCTPAVPRMPRCWIANVSSISTAPMKNAALKEKLTGPIRMRKERPIANGRRHRCDAVGG